MTEAQKKKRRPLPVFLLLSLLIHLSLLLFFVFNKSTPPRPPPTEIAVEYLPAPPPQDPAAAAGEEDKKDRAKKEKPVDQIVEQDKQLNDEIDDTRFLSAFNQKVVQQTRADRAAKFTNQAKGGQTDEGVKDGDKSEELSDAKEVQKAKTKTSGELPSLKALSPKFSLTPGPKGPDAKDKGDPSATDDYLKEVKSGLQTMLSTREFVYYTYYARIKEAIRQHWEPDVRERVKIIYRTGRNIASSQDRVTQLVVTLNSQGELMKVEVLGQSGVEQLDSAAVEAFRSAAPFPNPPQGMIEKDGTIKIRWDFVLEV